MNNIIKNRAGMESRVENTQESKKESKVSELQSSIYGWSFRKPFSYNLQGYAYREDGLCEEHWLVFDFNACKDTLKSKEYFITVHKDEKLLVGQYPSVETTMLKSTQLAEFHPKDSDLKEQVKAFLQNEQSNPQEEQEDWKEIWRGVASNGLRQLNHILAYFEWCSSQTE